MKLLNKIQLKRARRFQPAKWHRQSSKQILDHFSFFILATKGTMSTPQKSNSSSRGKKWRPQATKEARRLGNTEADWNLPSVIASGRTRSQRSTDDSVISTPRVALFAGVDEAESVSTGGVSSLTTDSASSKRTRPPQSRVIIEVNPAAALLQKYLKNCPKCESALAITFPTTCIASGCKITCTDEMCVFADAIKPCGSNVPLAPSSGSVKIKRNTDYALNVLYVIGFIASGDGPTEAGRILGLLGLPNSTTMKSRSFGNIERMISHVVQDYTEEILMNNLRNEVAAVFGDKTNTNGDRLYNLWLSDDLPQDQWPRIDGCADMGWQQKGSGRIRNSQSGHALVIAQLTRKAVEKEVCSKGCGYCKTWRTNHPVTEAPPMHHCFVNHEGSSGSMEPKAVCNMYLRLFNKRVIVKRFVADDDSSIKARLKWSNEDYKIIHNTTQVPRIMNSNGNLTSRPNHGKVPAHMPEPTFVADPNHRRKTMTNGLYALAALVNTSPEQQKENYDNMVKNKLKKAEKKGVPPPAIKPFKVKAWNLTMNKMDARRLSKNFAFMGRKLHYCTTDEEIINCGKAVLEHHFDNHDHCGDWCRRKKELAAEKAAAEEAAKQQQQQQQQDDGEDDEPTDIHKKFYRDKVKDKELYERLHSMIARFVTLEALKEIAHQMDTCANESFNNTASWLAPKNKVYAGTHSLQNRICIALGITSLGTLKYYQGLLDRMGIAITPDVAHFLQIMDASRQRRLERTKTAEFKIKRASNEMAKIKKEAIEATIARAKRDGVYKPGIGMTGGYDLETVGNDDNNKKKAAATTRKKNPKKGATTGKKPCQCGGTDHQRPSSRLCPFFVPRKRKKTSEPKTEAEVTMETEEMADEIDALDALPVDLAGSSSSGGESGFFSATSEFS